MTQLWKAGDVQTFTPNLIDLTTQRRVHIVAIGGTGMSAIAGVLLDMGHVVTGTDAAPSRFLDRVADAGATVWVGHDGSHIPSDVDAVAISTAVKPDNVEVLEAQRRGVPVLRRADLLASIAATRRTIAVAGTHGKTTTSTFLALALEGGGVRPSWVIGAELTGRGNGAHWDGGAWFVVEADESDATFLRLGAEAALVTNVEPDHLETYGGWEQLQAAFDTFVSSAPGARVVCIDDDGGRSLAERFDVITYGANADADYRLGDVKPARFATEFSVTHRGETAVVRLPMPGLHNARNATGAIAMAHQVGVPLEVSAAALGAYEGIGRRFQRRGESNGVAFVDDYAHLPTEVIAALQAARDGNWKRIVAVFQPHRYSRTEQVGKDFAGAFDAADIVVLTDIYSAGEPSRPGVSGEIVWRAIESAPDHPPVTYIADRNALAEEVSKLLREGDLCITIGAGDVTLLSDEIMQRR